MCRVGSGDQTSPGFGRYLLGTGPLGRGKGEVHRVDVPTSPTARTDGGPSCGPGGIVGITTFHGGVWVSPSCVRRDGVSRVSVRRPRPRYGGTVGGVGGANTGGTPRDTDQRVDGDPQGRLGVSKDRRRGGRPGPGVGSRPTNRAISGPTRPRTDIRRRPLGTMGGTPTGVFDGVGD